MKMKKFIASYFICFLLFAGTVSAQMNTLRSTDGNIVLKFQTGSDLTEPLTYQLFYVNKLAITTGKIKLKITDQKIILKKTGRTKKIVVGKQFMVNENSFRRIIIK